MGCDSIDTNIILRMVAEDNPTLRDISYDYLNRDGSKHRVFDVAIIEAVHTLKSYYQQSRTQIAENLTSFFYQFSDTLDYNRTIVKMVLPYWVEHPALSFTDCYLAFMADYSGVCPLMTLDKKLASQHPAAKVLA